MMNSKFHRFFLLTVALLLPGAALLLTACGETTPPPVAKPEKPHRKTFETSSQDLIDRYNKIAADIDRSLLLPPVNAMADGGKNDKFHAIMHTVKANLHISMEIDNVTGKPFSLSVTAAPSGQDEQFALVGILPSIGAAIFGKGEQAGILIDLCSKTKGKEPVSLKMGGFEAYCANAMGLWMAGISASKEESNALKTTN